MTVRIVTEEFKRKLSDVAKTSSLNRPQLAKKYGVSTRTLYRILKECADKPLVDVELKEKRDELNGLQIDSKPIAFVNKDILIKFDNLYSPLNISTELRKVYKSLNDTDKKRFLTSPTLKQAFSWHGSPQGGEFWKNLYMYLNNVNCEMPSLDIFKSSYISCAYESLPRHVKDHIESHWYIGRCNLRRFCMVLSKVFGIDMELAIKTELQFRRSKLTPIETDALGLDFESFIRREDGELFRTTRKCLLLEDTDDSIVYVKAMNTILTSKYRNSYMPKIWYSLDSIVKYTQSEYKDRYLALRRQVYIVAYNNGIELRYESQLKTVLEMINPELLDVYIALVSATEVDMITDGKVRFNEVITKILENGVTQVAFPYSIKMPVIPKLKSDMEIVIEQYINNLSVKITDMPVYKTLYDNYGILHPDRSLKLDLFKEIRHYIMNCNLFSPTTTFKGFVDWENSIFGESYWVSVLTHVPTKEEQLPSHYVITQSTVAFSYQNDPYVVNRTHTAFTEISNLVLNGDFETAAKLTNQSDEITSYMDGVVNIKDGVIQYYGYNIDNDLTKRMLIAMKNGDKETLDELIMFFKLLMENPDKYIIDDLFVFLTSTGIEIDKYGYIIAYKKVQSNYTDYHTGKIDNSVGTTVVMPRWLVDKDRTHACSTGLHVCSLTYLPRYHGSDSTCRYLLCKIHPRNVVSIPTQHILEKMRVCQYEVVEDVTDKFNK